MTASDRIVDDFPALERLDDGARRRRVPFIEQQTPTECGAACLAMVLGYFGKHLRVIDVKTGLQTTDMPFGIQLISSPAIVDNMLYVGTYGNEILA